MRFLFLLYHARSIAQLRVADYLNATLVKELRGSDDRGIAVALDGFEVGPVLGYDLRFPPPCADRN